MGRELGGRLRNFVRGIVLILSLSFAMPRFVWALPPGDEVRTSFQDSLGTLARAHTLAQLEREWQHSPRDYAFRAVHAAMYAKLGGGNPGPVLLQAMPNSGDEMEALYDAQDTRQGQDMAVTSAYYAYYMRLADALMHDPEQLPKFLKMIHAFNFVDNVDEWPWLCGLASKIYDANPDAYIAAANQLEPGFRKQALDCKEPP